MQFSQKRQDESAPFFFFSGIRRKHLFIITCIEKHCTRAFNTPRSKQKSLMF